MHRSIPQVSLAHLELVFQSSQHPWWIRFGGFLFLSRDIFFLLFCLCGKTKTKNLPFLIFGFAIFGCKMQCCIIIFSWILFGLIRPQDEQKNSSSLFPPEVVSNVIVIFFHFINLNMAWIKCMAVYLLLMWRNVTRKSKKKFWVLNHLKIPFHSVWYSLLSIRIQRNAVLSLCQRVWQDPKQWIILLRLYHLNVGLIRTFFPPASTCNCFYTACFILLKKEK